MKWVTRERLVIDRIACPWLISRFIDQDHEFLYVPPDRVIAAAQETRRALWRRSRAAAHVRPPEECAPLEEVPRRFRNPSDST